MWYNKYFTLCPFLYSTSSANIFNTTLSQALLLGQPADGELFLPNRIPQLDFSKFSNKSSYIEVCTAVFEAFVEDDPDINSEMLRSEIAKHIDFEPQIIKIADSRYQLDLNTGPTYAFKDYSQDPNIKIVVLYPKGRVSEDQRKLMTTIGGNIHCLEVAGDFDLCQSLAKTALADTKINSHLSSANSINWGRLLGQIPYYIWANLQLKQDDKKTIFSVPSGNLGNVTAGYIVKLMGNSTQKLIISHNQNSPMQGLVLDELLHYKSISVVTHSSAIGVTNSSNLRRLVNLYGGELTNYGVLQKTPDISAM